MAPLGLFGSERYQALPQDLGQGDIETAYLGPESEGNQPARVTPIQWLSMKINERREGDGTTKLPVVSGAEADEESNLMQRMWKKGFGNNSVDGAEEKVMPGELLSKPGESRVVMAASCLPQVINFTVPEEATPGTEITVNGPNGSLKVIVPEDGRPGRQCKFPIRPPPDCAFKVTVPEYALTGDPVKFKGPEGREMYTKVPAGRKPGDTFLVFPPLQMVQVPPGARRGDSLAFSTQDGRTLVTALPEKQLPGDYFPVYI